MARWDQKRKSDAKPRPERVTPTPKERTGKTARRGSGLRNRDPFELPDWMKGAAISTPRGGQRPKPQNQGAPPQAAEKPTPDTTPKPKPPTAPQGSGGKTERTNPGGLKQYGTTLGGLNAFTSAFTGGYELDDIKSAFQSEDLPTAYQSGSNTISTEETPYELPEGAAPSPLNKALAGTKDLEISDTTYTIGDASVPGTIGRSDDVQEGSSAKPDVAESVRTLRMKRKGPRDEGGPRGFAIDNHNAMVAEANAPEQKSGGIYNNKRRNEIRSTFLDSKMSSVKAITAARAKAGIGNDSNGTNLYNFGGELVRAKEGMDFEADNAAMMGQNPTQFLDIPQTPDTEPDKPADSELNPAPLSTVTPGSIEMPENVGGSFETPELKTKPSPAKQKQAEDFLSQNISMLTRRTK